MAFVTDGPDVFEYSQDAATEAAQHTDTGFGGYASGFNREVNPVSSWLLPRAEESAYREHDWFRDYLVGNANAMGANLTSDDAYTPSPKISPEDADQRYGISGVKPLFSEPVEDKLAQTVYQHKREEIQAQSDMQRFQENHGFLVTAGASAVASLMDPINLAVGAIPVLGEEGILARMGYEGVSAGLGARIAARAISGAATAPVQTAITSGLKLAVPVEGSDFNIRDAMSDILYSVPSGALANLAFGSAVNEPLRYLTKDLGQVSKRAAADALAQRGETASVGNTNPETNAAAVRTGMSQMLAGKPVDVSDYFPKAPESALGRILDNPFMEKAEPVDLGLDRTEVARTLEPDMMKQFEDLQARRENLSGWYQDMTKNRQDVAGMEQQLADLQSQVRPKMGPRKAPLMKQIADLQEQLDNPSLTKPSDADMARVQKQMMDAEYAMRDMAPQITDVMSRADEHIARANLSATADRLDDLIARRRAYSTPDTTGMLRREFAWRDTGVAPGMSQPDLARAIVETEAAAKNGPVPQQKVEQPPRNWLEPAVAHRQRETAAETPQGTPTEAAGEGKPSAQGNEAGIPSSSEIQRQRGVGYMEAARIRDQMIAQAGQPAPLSLEDAFPDIDTTKLNEEDRAELLAAQRNVEQATRMEDAYREAALCVQGP